jgi:hypothetical protein
LSTREELLSFNSGSQKWTESTALKTTDLIPSPHKMLKTRSHLKNNPIQTLRCEILSRIKHRKSFKSVKNRLKRYRSKLKHLSTIFNLHTDVISNWNSEFEATEAAVNKFHEELNHRSKFPPFSWFQKSISKMNKSEMSSLRKSIAYDEKSLTLPMDNALGLAEN